MVLAFSCVGERLMPIDYRKYPPNWKSEIRPRILERAGDCCERCGVKNSRMIKRRIVNPACYVYIGSGHESGAIFCGPYPETDLKYHQSEWDKRPAQQEKFNRPIKIVLTIAHLDNKLTDHSDENLMAMCQRCHLTHDAFMRKMEKK